LVPTRTIVLAGLLAACGPSSTQPPVHATSVVIVADRCSRLSKSASHQAAATMSRLVEHCNAVPRPMTFRVVLEPTGAISFASAGAGGTDEIPLCVASQKLQHHVRLRSPCSLDVRFEPTSLSLH
jgi:hypothetical protein